MTDRLTPCMTVEDLSAFLDQAFPPALRAVLGTLVEIAPGRARLSLQPGDEMIRPGGIVSGPAQMGLIDVAAYAVILAHIGPVAMAVTSTVNVSFLRACSVEEIFADASLLKLGRRLASVDVRLSQGKRARLVAQATVGYALPG
ncbi:MAG: PaaI family thioesterase [Sphingobium sp.]